MIKGIGTDIVSVQRMSSQLKERILSIPEKELYDSFTSEDRKNTFLAGRFAAKEAIAKALSHTDLDLSYRELIILNDEHGKPYLQCDKLSGLTVWISIAHEQEYAVGFCLIETLL